jgi:hypothetical protein
MTNTIEEMQKKIAYYYKRIDECNETINMIKEIENKKNSLYNKQTNNTPPSKVLPKGWT